MTASHQKRRLCVKRFATISKIFLEFMIHFDADFALEIRTKSSRFNPQAQDPPARESTRAHVRSRNAAESASKHSASATNLKRV